MVRHQWKSRRKGVVNDTHCLASSFGRRDYLVEMFPRGLHCGSQGLPFSQRRRSQKDGHSSDARPLALAMEALNDLMYLLSEFLGKH